MLQSDISDAGVWLINPVKQKQIIRGWLAGIMEEERIVESQLHRTIRIVLRYVLIGVLILGIAFILFSVFRIKNGGDYALREAKNARLALIATGIEYRGSGKSIYTSSRISGMTNEVYNNVKELSGADGNLRLVRYDYDSNEVRQLQYRQGQYLVSFDMDDNGEETWTVEYIIPLDLK